MSTLKPVEREDFARSIGLPSDDEGLPTRGSVADAIRSFVSVKGMATWGELEDWFDTLASAAGYTGESVVKRLRSVCSQLIAVGDCAAAKREDATYLISVEPKTIDLDFEYDLVLGGAHVRALSRSSQDIVRRVSRQLESVSLFDHLPSPPWVAIADSLNLSRETSPSQLLNSIRLAGGPIVPQQETGLVYKSSVNLPDTGLSLSVATDGHDRVPLICIHGELGNERFIRLESEEYMSWLYLSKMGIDGTSDWPEDLILPSSVLAALSLVGEAKNDDLTNWVLTDRARITLAEWLGVPLAERHQVSVDLEQSKLIDSPTSARLLVAAGPGAGKTWTGCMRVSKLIKAGMSPSRILIISFTRAAVAEIRARIASFLEEPRDALQLNIQTLDSLAWSLNMGAGGGGRISGDFDSSISAALQLLAFQEDWLLDEIERYQHVLIDEAQDFTGDRRALVLALLRNLAEECGVTVFHDPAQAIYGYLDAGAQSMEVELKEWDPPFEQITLNRNYRCKAPSLETMFADGRSLLQDTSLGAREIYSRIRERIEETAIPVNDRHTENERRNTFRLYRSHGQLNSAIDRALRTRKPFRTRLSQHRNLIQPWIAATLHGFVGLKISEGEFAHLYNDLRPHPGVSVDFAWQSLRRLCGSAGKEIDLVKLTELMLGSYPLPEITISDIGPRTAPLYSTIHAAKGREAETVVLSLPFEPYHMTNDQILEEARVLYVAATRASTELRLAASPRGMKTLDSPSQRTWSEWPKSGSVAAKVEVGCAGDVKQTLHSTGTASKEDANFVLWQASDRAGSVLLTFADGRYRITMSDTEVEVGSLSKDFNLDLSSISRQITQERVFPARKIEGAFMLGATSRVVLDDEGRPSFSLAPILSGTPLVFFNRA